MERLEHYVVERLAEDYEDGGSDNPFESEDDDQDDEDYIPEGNLYTMMD